MPAKFNKMNRETEKKLSTANNAKPLSETYRIHRERRRLFIIRSALVGLSAGFIAVLFQLTLGYAETGREQLLIILHKDCPYAGWIFLPLITGTIGAFAGWLTQRFAPNASGSGIPHIKGVLVHTRKMSWHRLLPVKFIGGILSIGSGFSLGREGPTVQMGAASARAVAGFLRIPRTARNQLIACGAGAGLAAAFNAPFAGFIFVIEELRRELSPLTYSMSIISAVVSVVVTQSILGQGSSFHISGYPMPPLCALPFFVILGIWAGLTGVLFNKGLLWLQRKSNKHFRLSLWQKAGIIGILIGLAGWWLPEALGTGHRVAEKVLSGVYATSDMIGFLTLLFIVKFIFTLISYITGLPGGIFAPMLLLGSLAGLLTGIISSAVFPDISGTPAAYAVAGMASFFAAVVRAPFTGVVLVLEMTANYEQLFPLLVSCMVAYIISERLKTKPIYEALLAYDLERNVPKQAIYQEPILIEVSVEPNSAMDGHKVYELGLPKGCLIVTIYRAGKELIPDGGTVLRAGDHVTLVVSGDVASVSAFINHACHSC